MADILALPERKALIKTALGEIPLDLVIENVKLVNVYTGLVEQGAIGIKAGRIVTPFALGYEAERTIDGEGRYAIPGFIDSHVHLDSTLVTPENLGQLLLPRGTTVMLADPMEIANVAGMAGFKAFQSARGQWLFHVFWEVSSRVPTAPGLETTGGELGLEEVTELINWPESVSLGELDPSKVLDLRDEYLLKVEAAHRLGKICNGHAAGRGGKEFVAYTCGGLSDDHECVDFAEAFTRLRFGLAVLIREGSTERNLEPILKGLVESGLYSSPHLMFCTDDKHPDDILKEGHIDYMVNQAIELGVPPVTAIQMATINPARHFRIDHILGSLAPGRWADIILADDLQNIKPHDVFFKGVHAVHEGQLIVPLPQANYPDWLYKTVKVQSGKVAGDFRLAASGHHARLWVIDLLRDQIVNKRIEAELQVVEGAVLPDVSRDFLKLAVVERYGQNGNIGIAFVRGFGLRDGALASSVAHDHHNIIVVGTNDEDMAVCVRAIEEMQGGFVIACGREVIGRLALPIGGLLSEQPVDEIISELDEINGLYRQRGGVLPFPFMTLSFIGLPTVPELGLTDRGLIDVIKHTLMSPFVA